MAPATFPKSASSAPAAGALLVEAQTAKEEQSRRVGCLGLRLPSEIGLERARGRHVGYRLTPQRERGRQAPRWR